MQIFDSRKPYFTVVSFFCFIIHESSVHYISKSYYNNRYINSISQDQLHYTMPQYHEIMISDGLTITVYTFKLIGMQAHNTIPSDGVSAFSLSLPLTPFLISATMP